MTTPPPHQQRSTDDPNRDLGFGAVVANESRRRLLNRDGSFNVRKSGVGVFGRLRPYHFLLTEPWPRLAALVGAFYVLLNALFAGLYLLSGHGGLLGIPESESPVARFADTFFFSVQTFATIGYGAVHPAPTSLVANVLVTVESLVGLLFTALVTGLTFARFSRPRAEVVFSARAVIAPFRGGTAFMFRIVNARESQIVEVEARLLYTRRRANGGQGVRDFLDLALERQRVVFFPLAWTVVHPIDAASPLYGATAERLEAEDAEFLVLLTGTDDTLSQTVHARSSYKPNEVVWGARFRNMFQRPAPDGTLGMDVRRLHDIEYATVDGALAAAAGPTADRR